MAPMALITTSLNKKKRIAFTCIGKRRKFSFRRKYGDAASTLRRGLQFPYLRLLVFLRPSNRGVAIQFTLLLIPLNRP